MSSINTDMNLIANALSRLKHLDVDQYIISLGPGNRQFIATCNGYAATYLPTQPLAELAVGDIEKVTWVAFGSTVHSWFFTYAFKNGATTFRLGKGVPGPLREYVDRFGKQADLEGTLRVQLGHANSFVVWSRTAWACSDNIPDELRKRLCTISSGTRGGQNITMGSLKKGTLINVQWNMDDSYYLETTYAHGRRFQSAMLVEAWRSLWPGLEACIFGQEHLAEIAHLAINGHAPSSEQFAIFKKRIPGDGLSFILHMGQEPVHARLPNASYSVRALARKTAPPPVFWAVCAKSGRPHGAARDTWELSLKEGQVIKVLEKMQADWYIVIDQKGAKGYAHGSWLDFDHPRLHCVDARAAWLRFADDSASMRLGPVAQFLRMADYVAVCTRDGCKQTKEDEACLGICAHDLEVLLRGSGKYCYEWLKEERNMWHPDRFSQFCMPARSGALKLKAQQLFVLYGVLMERF